jgi:DNA-binding response OmpR family regulator
MFSFADLTGNETRNRPMSRLGQGGSTLESVPIILVVEDDPLIQGVVEETLTDGGFEIVIVSSAENAIDLLDVQKVKYRAVVTDINLGHDRMEGWDVARRAREIDAKIPVVYMTGASADDWASNGVPNSILVTKPFAPAQLLTAVSQLLNEGS